MSDARYGGGWVATWARSGLLPVRYAECWADANVPSLRDFRRSSTVGTTWVHTT